MSIKELTDEQVLENFLLDIDCLDELSMWTEKFNIFDVLKISRTEIRHSNMLAWLFDANENHGLGDKFVKKIMQKFVENDLTGKFDVFEILLLDFYNFNIYREWNNIDLLLVSDDEETVIAIENKVGSHEHSNQLNRYRELLENEYPNYNRIYIFLTPDGILPSDTDNWGVLTYTDIADVLTDIKEITELLPDVELLIDNYMDVVRRDIVDDYQLIDICNKIYAKHKKALDLIYENRTNYKEIVKNIVFEAMNELDACGKVDYTANSVRFHTKCMSKYLPCLDDTVSSWGNAYPYLYWINICNDKFEVIFELGGKSLPDETIKLMQPLIDELSPKDTNKIDFKFKRLKRFTFDIDFENVSKEEIKSKFLDSIDEVLLWEEKLLEKIQKKQYEY